MTRQQTSRARCASWPFTQKDDQPGARLLPLYPVSKRSPAGLSQLQRDLQHEDKVPCRAAERKRSRARDTHTNARHFDPQSGRPDVKSRRKPPSFSAMFGAFNALLRTVPRVHHREESRPEASGEEKTPATQGKRKKLCNMQYRASWSCPFQRAHVPSPPPVSSGVVRCMNVLLLQLRAGSGASGIWRERPLKRMSREARGMESKTLERVSIEHVRCARK